MKVWQVLLIILVILIAVLVVLYFLGKRAQKKQEENQAQIEAAKQTVNMLIIDKKRLRIKESGPADGNRSDAEADAQNKTSHRKSKDRSENYDDGC